MRSNILLLAASAVLLLAACTSPSNKRAIEIIEKSIESHGGEKSWHSLEFISLEKETKLFFENGEIESHLVQELEFRKKPFFEGKITWNKDSLMHKLIFDGAKTRYWMGQNEILNEGFLLNKKKDFDAAYYVLSKPFDLLDGEKYFEYQGLTKLQDGQEVETVQVIDGDPNDKGADIWWYFFEKESNKLAGYKVKTSDHYSMVYNTEWDDSTGVLFPSRRESYRVDSLGKHLYLRAKYSYSAFNSQ